MSSVSDWTLYHVRHKKVIYGGNGSDTRYQPFRAAVSTPTRASNEKADKGVPRCDDIKRNSDFLGNVILFIDKEGCRQS